MTPATRVLVAGVRNIFLGDDAFGVEVARRLVGRTLPEGVRVVDFGTQGLDLAFALEACEAAILVDATPRGGAPGTLYVLEPTAARAADASPIDDASAHGMTLDRVLARLPRGALPRRIRLVGCEPTRPGEGDGDDEAMALSGPVSAAIEEAARLVEALVGDSSRSRTPMHELAITQDIVEAVCARAGGARVVKVVVEIGKLSLVLPDAVRFCFELCCEDTPLAGAELEIVEPPGRARCCACGAEVELSRPFGRCDCGSTDLAWLSGDELRIREMEVV